MVSARFESDVAVGAAGRDVWQPAIEAVSSSSDQMGWAFGGGLEYAFLSNWSAKIEYLYVDLGSFNTGSAPLVNNVSFKESIVRGGLNYKFSGPIF
jgi:outer membrane immunogenic protein